MSAIVFEDLEENVLHNIIKSASIKINKKADESRILTKEGIVKMSNTITDLHNSFNKILAFNSNIAKIHQIEAARVEEMGKENLMERGGQLSPPSIPESSASNSELTQLVPKLTKTVADLANELKSLNLISPQADAIPSMPMDEGGLDFIADVDAPDKRRTRSRFGRMGLAGKALGIFGVGMDVFDRAGSGQGAGQIAAGVAGGVGGGVLGAKAGAALGALGGPAAPITVPLGALLGGALGYFGGSAAGDVAYEAVAKPESIPQRKGEQAREQKQRSNKLFSAFAKNITNTAAAPIGAAMAAGTAAYNLSDKFASYLGNTMSSISNYVTSIPERLANLGSNIYDTGSAFIEGAVGMATGAVDAPYQFVRSTIGADELDWDIYRNTIAQIESQGKYDILGGSGKHYDGRYQMGRDAKIEAGRILGMPIAHDAGSRAQFRGDPHLQERAFAAFTVANHKRLMSNPKYANASKERKLQVLGYAHNQGGGGANKWLNTGIVGADGFGTKGTKYTDALARNFRNRGSFATGQMFGGMVNTGREFVGDVVEAGREMLTGAGRFIYPVAAVRITSNFGPRKSPTAGASSSHGGIDLGPRRPGTQGDAVFASAEGVVTRADYSKSYGNVVYVDHGDGFETRYAHLRGFTVGRGQRVQKGQQVGQLGNTGIGTGPHLHFEIRRNGRPINPITMLDSATVRPDNTATEPSNEQVQPATRQDKPARSQVAAQAQEGAIRRRSDGRRGFGGGSTSAPQPRVPAVAGASPKRAAKQSPANPRPWYQWILGG